MPVDGIYVDVGVGEVCWFRAWDIQVEYSQSMAGTDVVDSSVAASVVCLGSLPTLQPQQTWPFNNVS